MRPSSSQPNGEREWQVGGLKVGVETGKLKARKMPACTLPQAQVKTRRVPTCPPHVEDCRPGDARSGAVLAHIWTDRTPFCYEICAFFRIHHIIARLTCFEQLNDNQYVEPRHD